MTIEGSRIKVYRNLKMLDKSGKESFSINCSPENKGQPEVLEQHITEAYFYFFGQYKGHENGSEIDRFLRESSYDYGILGDVAEDDTMTESSTESSAT